MIIDNRIIFGHGDVGVFSNKFSGYIEFVNLKPPQEIGTDLSKVENIEYGLNIKLYDDKPFGLYNLIKTVNKDNTIIEFTGYILDFSNYNEKSVEVVRVHAQNMCNIMTLAC